MHHMCVSWTGATARGPSHIPGCAMAARRWRKQRLLVLLLGSFRRTEERKKEKESRRKDEGIRKKKDWGDKIQKTGKKEKKRKQVKCITQLSDSNNKCSHFSLGILALKQSTPTLQNSKFLSPQSPNLRVPRWWFISNLPHLYIK